MATTTTTERPVSSRVPKGGLKWPPFSCMVGDTMRSLVVLLALLLQSGIALAHGDDKPKHGGIMGRGDDTVTVEFVYANGIITVYVEDHDSATPIPAEKLKGAWLSVQGSRAAWRSRAKLIPAGGEQAHRGGSGSAGRGPAERAPHPAQRHGDVVGRYFPRGSFPALEWFA